ncbi:ras-related and estrogen-regulated growth inhibitor-like protein isoform X2 [Betta splendens]|uniref:small monomeric GTPase n=1 Tax=Betta splendens TaxID=158456 RepID=A0A8M1HFN6_BETSP|nr:ras-related and estrogen-regulated growth inhibitor-like protein isoform X2 [Betta splendens]
MDVNIAVMGTESVGKSALTVRLLTRRFIGEYGDIESIYSHSFAVDGREISLNIWDSPYSEETPASPALHRRGFAPGEEGPVGRRLRPRLQHLRQSQLHRRRQARPDHQVHQRRRAHRGSGQQAGPAAQARGAERRGPPAGPQRRLPLLRGVGGGELPRRARGASRAGGRDEGRQQEQQEAPGAQGHREKHVRGVRPEADGLVLRARATWEKGARWVRSPGWILIGRCCGCGSRSWARDDEGASAGGDTADGYSGEEAWRLE